MKKILFISFVIMLVSISFISIVFIYKDKKEDYEQEKVFEEITNIVNKVEEKEENTINIKELYEINNDIVGWIQIDNTNMNYPVMQTKDKPNYYLKRNFYKEYSSLGTPYMAENCNIETSNNLIIYGHHIKGKKVFGELENYKSKEYYNSHKNIIFYTIQEKAEYEIIAVFKTIAYTGFRYYEFYNIKDEKEFNTFIKKCKELSFYGIEETAKYGDRLITLSTCEYSNKNGRLVVVARKVI